MYHRKTQKVCRVSWKLNQAADMVQLGERFILQLWKIYAQLPPSKVDRERRCAMKNAVFPQWKIQTQIRVVLD